MDDRQEAVAMYIEGVDPVDIAAELGTTLVRIHNWIINTDVIATLRSQRNKAIVEAYVSEDNPIAIGEMCKEFGVSQGTIYRVLHKAGVEMRRVRRGSAQADELDAQVVAMYREGVTIHNIRSSTGYSLNRIYDVIDENKLPRRRSW